MELKGYAILKYTADCKYAMGDAQDWQGQIVRVMEFNDDSQSILAMNSKANGLATFDYSDVVGSFKCGVVGDVIIPPGLEPYVATLESIKRINRKGGYNNTLKHMVITNSLCKGEFDDGFLFAKQ